MLQCLCLVLNTLLSINVNIDSDQSGGGIIVAVKKNTDLENKSTIATHTCNQCLETRGRRIRNSRLSSDIW